MDFQASGTLPDAPDSEETNYTCCPPSSSVVSPHYERSVYGAKPTRERRISFGLSAAVHIGFIAALLTGLGASEVLPGAQVSHLTAISFGSTPPSGDPSGNDAPPSSTPDDQIIAEQDVEVEADQDVPSDESPTLIDSTDESSMETNEPQASQASTSPVSAESFGAGTLALGAKTHGDIGGLDGDLATAVGSAIATQIKACWDAPKAVKSDTQSITMTATFDRNGNLSGEPVIHRLVDQEKHLVTEPDAYEQAALTAVEKCSPIRLPPHLFAYWNVVDIQIFSAMPLLSDPSTSDLAHNE